MLNNRSIRKKMVHLLGQHHPKPVNKPKTILYQHELIPDSARKEVFRDKRLNVMLHYEDKPSFFSENVGRNYTYLN
ncbi:hypothetical protein YC2023_095561 [Brassica napus]